MNSLEQYRLMLLIGNLDSARKFISQFNLYGDKLVAMKIASELGYENLLEEIFPVDTNDNSLWAHIRFRADPDYRFSLILNNNLLDEVADVSKCVYLSKEILSRLSLHNPAYQILLDAHNGKYKYTGDRRINCLQDKIKEKEFSY